MTIEQAVSLGFSRVNTKYTGSKQCPNMHAYKNRVIMAAARAYCDANYTKKDIISDVYRANHYGVPVGYVRVIPAKVTPQVKANVIKDIRAFIRKGI